MSCRVLVFRFRVAASSPDPAPRKAPLGSGQDQVERLAALVWTRPTVRPGPARADGQPVDCSTRTALPRASSKSSHQFLEHAGLPIDFLADRKALTQRCHLAQNFPRHQLFGVLLDAGGEFVKTATAASMNCQNTGRSISVPGVQLHLHFLPGPANCLHFTRGSEP